MAFSEPQETKSDQPGEPNDEVTSRQISQLNELYHYLSITQRRNDRLDDYEEEDGDYGLNSPEWLLAAKLQQLPENERLALLQTWWQDRPALFIQQLSNIRSLPDVFQAQLADYFDSNPNAVYGTPSEQIIHLFPQITDEKLQQWLLRTTNFRIIARYRARFAGLTDEELLRAAPRLEEENGRETEAINWEKVLPYIDHFSVATKERAIDEVLADKKRHYTESSLILYKDQLGLSSREVIDLFIDNGKLLQLINAVGLFEPEYHLEIAERCIAEHLHIPVLVNAKYLAAIDVNVLLAKYAEDFAADGYDPDEMIANMLAKQLRDLPADWFDQLPATLIERIVTDHPEQVAQFADKFKDRIDKAALIETLFEREAFVVLVRSREKLGISNQESILMRIIDAGGCNAVCWAIRHNQTNERFPHAVYQRLVAIDHAQAYPITDRFEGVTPDEVAEIVIYMQFESFEHLALQLQKFETLEPHDYVMIARRLINSGAGLLVAQGLETVFAGLKADSAAGEKMFESCLSQATWDVPLIIKLYHHYRPPSFTAFTAAFDIFGEQISREAYETTAGIADGTIDQQELAGLGCDKVGEAGLSQLRQQITKFRATILSPNFDDALLQQEVFARYYQRYMRIDRSEWGKHDTQSLHEVVANHSRLQEEGAIIPLSSNYTPSEQVRVNKKDKKMQDEFVYSESFLSRWHTLRNSLVAATEAVTEHRPLSRIIERAEVTRGQLVTQLHNKLETLISEQAHPKAIANLHSRLETLQSMKLRSMRDWQENFSFLAQFREFEEDLRQILFIMALHDHPTTRDQTRLLAHRDKPEFNDVSEMIHFVEHIVNEETWKRYFTNPHAAKASYKLTNLRALEEEFVRAQNQAEIKGTMPLEFVPSRGLPLEFSGHIADACWASHYDSIAAEYPNFSAVVMVQNRDTKFEQLAGAALQIEALASDGTPLLIIRGLNPVQNLINGLDVEDYFAKFTDYMRGQAAAAGRKLAIVIDDHSGGSGTNRPVLFDYLASIKKGLHKVELDPSINTTFNTYNIAKDVYLL